MPDDATEGVAEHSSRLQPSINLHTPVTALQPGLEHGHQINLVTLIYNDDDETD